MQAAEYPRLFAAEERLWWFRALHRAVRNLLPAAASGRRLLELGCGTGGLMAQLHQAGFAVSGVDYAAQALHYAHARWVGPVARASANQLPFANASFDCLTCVDVLEVGTVDPQALVHNALRVLRPGGQAVFVMAAHQWLLSEHDRAVNSVRRFNRDQLQALFAGQPVRILRSSYLFMLLFPLVVLHKLTNKPKSGESVSDVSVPPAAVNVPLYWLCWLEAQAVRLFNLPLGSSVMIVVKKDD